MNLINQIHASYIHYLLHLVLFSMRHAWLVIGLCLGLAAANLTYTIFYLPINSNQETLVSRENAAFQRSDAFAKIFPQQDHTIIALLIGDNPWRVGKAAEQLTKALQARGDLFKNVFYPQGMAFFQQNGLLYLNENDLAQFTDGLAQAQPAMAELAKDPNLRGLWNLLQQGLEAQAKQQAVPESFNLIIEQLALATEDFLAHRPIRDLWADAFPDWHTGNKKQAEALQLIIVQPHLDFSHLLSGKKGIDSLREIANSLRLTQDGVRLMLTGREPITLDELSSILMNIKIAALISTIAIIILLGFGIGSSRIIMIILGVLFVGICWSLGWAALSVGELNLLSSAFVVLFLGICIDFSIHMTLRYREEYNKCNDSQAAMTTTIENIGGAISLCALATAIGFLSFAPTDFLGLRDLGIIAGGSMFLALLANWTLLPALLHSCLRSTDLTQDHTSKSNKAKQFSSAINKWIMNHFRVISIGALFLGVAALPYALNIQFDHSMLSIKDPQSESILALKILQRLSLHSDYTATLLAPNRKQALIEAKKFETLPFVSKVETHQTYVPNNQENKAEIIQEAAFFMTPVLSAPLSSKKLTNQALGKTARRLLAQLAAKKKNHGSLSTAEAKLELALTHLLNQRPQDLIQFNQKVMGDYAERLERLALSLEAEPFAFEDLPKNVRAQHQALDGQIKITIYPKTDMTHPDAIKNFVEALNQQSDQLFGRPFIEYAVSTIVVRSFQIACSLALLLICTILLLSLRSIKNTLMVLSPIMLTSVWLLALCVFLDISFNVANIIVLPLILGLGVANGIHILARSERQENMDEVMQSSTPVAIFLSNATTLASFCSLITATHLGLHSMGTTLSLGMVLMLLAALIVLPAIIVWSKQSSKLAN